MKKINLDPKNKLEGQAIPVEVIDPTTQKVIAQYPTISKAIRTLGTTRNLSRALKNQDKVKRLTPFFSKALNKDVYIKKLLEEENHEILKRRHDLKINGDFTEDGEKLHSNELKIEQLNKLPIPSVTCSTNKTERLN